MDSQKDAAAENSPECNALEQCPVMTSLAVIGGKWKPAILYFLQQHDVLRFGELRKLTPGITQKMLSQQLKELQADGIVSRRVYAEVPPRVEYRLTELGQSLGPMLNAMAEWGAAYGRRL